jgi:hypothetical protein
MKSGQSLCVYILRGEYFMEVLILLLEGEHHSVETGVEFVIGHESVFFDDCLYKSPVFGVAFGIVDLLEVVHPIILRVVLDIG